MGGFEKTNEFLRDKQAALKMATSCLTFALHSPTMLPMAITRRQHDVLDFVRRFVEQHGYSPSFEEIGTALGLSSLATVHKHISNLEEKGLLKRGYNRS